MKLAHLNKPEERGFTLIELLTALAIFLIITGAAFTLLTSSQKRYQTESQVLTSFQEARLGLDQMVRDINDAGFPPPTYKYPVSATKFNYLTSAPFAWSLGAGYPNTPCAINTCPTSTAGDYAPGNFDIIIETNPNYNPSDPASQVQWIRYQLQGTTLMRGIVNKVHNDNPDADTAPTMVPFVQNVVNNSPSLVIGTSPLSASYPTVFSSGSVPIFQYTCDQPPPPPANPQFPLPPTVPCPSAGSDDSPANIRDVIITLIVAAPLPDATTGKPRLVQLEGRGRRINPNQ